MIAHNTVLLILLTRLTLSAGQNTLTQDSCSFQDGSVIYNVELHRGLVEQPCPTETISNQYKDLQQRSAETESDLSLVKSTVIRVMENNLNLTRQVLELQQELQVTKDAFRLSKAAASECPPLYNVPWEDSCYIFVGRELSWYDAQTFCMSTGGHLLAVETPAEQTFVVNYIRSSNVLPGQHMWTGGNDIAKEDQWVWAGINTPFNYTAWLLYPHHDDGPVQMPDNHEGMEHCVHLFHLHGYEWNDIYCGYKYYFVCEFKTL